MRLALWNRLCIAFEVLTIRSGHAHTAQEKQLPVFQRGYDAGRADAIFEHATCRHLQTTQPPLMDSKDEQ